MADDFRYSMRSAFNFILPQERIVNLFQMAETTYYDYLSLGARYVTVFLTCFVLSFGTALFKLLSPVMITAQVLLAAKIFSHDHSLQGKSAARIAIVLILLFSMISPAVMDEDLYWITGTIFYAWPVTFLLLHFGHYLFPQKKKETWLVLLLRVLLSVYLGSTAENISITTSFITLLIGVYYTWVEPKKDYWTKARKLGLLSLLIANLIQVLSPGTWNRSADFGNTSLLRNLCTGTFSFVQYQFFLSTLLPALLIGCLLYRLYHKNKKIFLINGIILIPLLCFILLYSLADQNWLYTMEGICRFIMPLDFYQWNQGMNQSLLVVLIYYWIVIVLFIVDVFYLCWK